METPITYTAYDAEGKIVGGPETGEDANNYIDPAKVQSAIQKVISVANDECKKIVNAIDGIVPALKVSLVVKGKTMASTAEQVSSIVQTIPGEISSAINPLYDLAVQEHDRKQQENNIFARAKVAASGGNVKESK